MGHLVTRQTILVLFYLIFFSHLNLGACAGFALANCDWLGRTIAFYQVFFQQGRVALGKLCIGPRGGGARLTESSYIYDPPIYDITSGRLYTFSTFSAFKIHNSVSLWVKITKKPSSIGRPSWCFARLCNRM